MRNVIKEGQTMQWRKEKKDKMTKALHMKLKIQQHERRKV